jgi:exopolysaccharide biosynthesis WecB/TagA/CpsF family protein
MTAAPFNLAIDALDLTEFGRVAAGFGTEGFGYVVTPNVDHMVRLSEEASFRACYEQARFVLLDSRILALLLQWRFGMRLPVCPGSDAVAHLFSQVIRPQDRIVLVGSTAAQAAALRSQFGLQDLRHVDLPMGFIRNPAAVADAIAQVESHSPFRFCLLAVGCPQQEILALRLAQSGRARGLALCIGASVNFITGSERRAPAWVQQLHMEWLYRLLQSPRRLAHRYLVRGPRLFTRLGRFRISVRRPQPAGP